MTKLHLRRDTRTDDALCLARIKDPNEELTFFFQAADCPFCLRREIEIRGERIIELEHLLSPKE